MPSTTSLVIVGNAAVDLTFFVERYPGPNEKCSAVAFHRHSGGQGVNMSIVAARLGLSCALVSKVGADDDGALVVAELARCGVQARIVREAGGRTPVVSVVVDTAKGTRACVHDKTGLRPLALAETDPNLVVGARTLLVDGRFTDVCRKLAQVARANGVRVVAAVERMTDQNRELCTFADVLIVPGTLALDQHPGTDLVAAGRQLMTELAVPDLIATCGADGCVVLSEGRTHRLAGFPAEVVDTVGAGDAFAAAVSAGLTWGWSLRVAAGLGNYVGARVCEGAGIPWQRIPERPTAAQVLALISHED